MVAKGFKQQEATASLEEYQARSIPIEDLEYETITIRDVPTENVPELPVGIFVEGEDGQVERHTTYTINPGIDKGLFMFELGKLEEAAGQNAKKVPGIIAQFFGGTRGCPPAIETIGGIPTADMARRLNTSTQKMFENMYLGDISTMLFGVRLKARKGRRVTINTPCPVTGCGETNRDDTLSLDEIEIKVIPDSVFAKGKPLFEIKLPKPISDGKGKISHFYCEPLKFYQIALFAGRGKPADFQILQATIDAIPESPIYGARRGKPFCEELYYELGEEGMEVCTMAIRKIASPGPGPVASLPYTCACGQQELEFAIPWARNPREFIYFMSQELREENL